MSTKCNNTKIHKNTRKKLTKKWEQIGNSPHSITKRNEGCMQRTAKQKQQKQAEQSDSWPSHKPQLPTRRNLVSSDFKNKNNTELHVTGYVLTATRSQSKNMCFGWLRHRTPKWKLVETHIDYVLNSYTKFMHVRSRLPHDACINMLTGLRLMCTCDTVYIMCSQH